MTARYGGGYHMVPANAHSIVVHDHDVLSGRGVNIAHHPGNERFRTLVTTKTDTNYCATYSTTEKKRAAEEIIRHIQSLDPPGRFLRREGRANNSRGLQGPWYELSEKETLKKTTQALRDCNRQDRTGYAIGVAMPEDVKQVMARQQNHPRQNDAVGGNAPPAPIISAASRPRKRSLSPSVEQGAKWLKRQRSGNTDVAPTLSPAPVPHVSTVTPAGSAEHGSTGSDCATTISAIGAPPAPPLAGVNYTSQPSLAMAPAPVLVYQNGSTVAPSSGGRSSAPHPPRPPHSPYPPPPHPSSHASFYAMEQHHLAQDLVHMATSVPPTASQPPAPTQSVYARAPSAYGRPAPPGSGAPVVYVQGPPPGYGVPARTPAPFYVADPLVGRTVAPSTPRDAAVAYAPAPMVTASPTSPARRRDNPYHPTYDTRQTLPAAPPMTQYQPVAPPPVPPEYSPPPPPPSRIPNRMVPPAPSPYVSSVAPVDAGSTGSRLVHHDHGGPKSTATAPPLPDTPTPMPAPAPPDVNSMQHYDYGMASDDGGGGVMTNTNTGSDASTSTVGDPIANVMAAQSSSQSQVAQGSADPLADLIAVSESVREDHLGFHIAAAADTASGGSTQDQDGTSAAEDVRDVF